MPRFYCFIALMTISCIVMAQDPPKIGSEKGVKEKLTRIKNAMPDFKKSLVKPSDHFADSYDVKMKLGNGVILFYEDKETTKQRLTVSFTSPIYFSGAKEDFQQYYQQLSGWLKDIFGKTHTANEDKTDKKWRLSFYENGKNVFTSPTCIFLSVSWVLNRPSISLEITTFPKGEVIKRKSTGGEEY